jgi:hypothetical protein
MEVLMDRLTQGAAIAAVVLSAAALTACGGGSGTTAAAPVEAPVVQSVDGVSTPSSVSVVTAKNAQ